MREKSTKINNDMLVEIVQTGKQLEIASGASFFRPVDLAADDFP